MSITSKLYWWKCPETASKKRNLDQKINYSKLHIWSLSFNFRFSSRKSQSQQKLAKRIIHCSTSFRSKYLTYFTSLNILSIVKNILPQHSGIPTHFKHFPANMFLVGVRKKICTAPFLDAQELHSLNTGEANVCIFPYISVRSFNLVVGWITSRRWLTFWAP